jgi:flagellar assembly factor FliW
MMVNSTRLGQLDVDEGTAIAFPRGVPGFENSTQWKLFHEEDDAGVPKAGVVSLMQSLNDPDVTLPVTDPVVFGIHYEFVLSDSEIAELKLEDVNDLAVLVVLAQKNTVPKVSDNTPLQNMGANLSAPLLVNVKSRIGIQKIFLGPEAKIEYRPNR